MEDPVISLTTLYSDFKAIITSDLQVLVKFYFSKQIKFNVTNVDYRIIVDYKCYERLKNM